MVDVFQPTKVFQSPEQVAFTLFELVALVEGRSLGPHDGHATIADRAYILDTYAECLSAVEGGRLHGKVEIVA